MYNVPGPGVAVLGAGITVGAGAGTQSLPATGFSVLVLGLLGAVLVLGGLLLVRIASTARRRQAA